MMFKIPEPCKKIIVTGGAGFIGGALVRKLLRDTDTQIFNIDKFGYASDLTSINNQINIIGSKINQRLLETWKRRKLSPVVSLALRTLPSLTVEITKMAQITI